MLSFRGKPAAIKALGSDDEVATLGSGPVQVFIDTFLGEPAEDARRNNDNKGQDDQQSDDAFFHDSVPVRTSRFGRS